MASVVLGVDAENVTGARRLYEWFGFGVVETQMMYRIPVVAAGDCDAPSSA
jgi:ribosomal protein S18 acetylase RimI-like enzyme